MQEIKLQTIQSLSGDKDYKSNLAMLKRVDGAIDNLSITKESDERRAIETVVKIKSAEKDLKAKLKYYIEGAEQTVKRFKAEFKPTFDMAKDVTQKINSKLMDYRREVERIAAQKADDARKKAETERKELEKKEREAKKADPEFIPTEVIPQAVIPVAEPTKTVASKSGSVTYRKIKKFEVLDFSKVPDKYKITNDVEIRKMMNAGVEVEGIRFFEDKIPSYRQ